VVKDIQRKGALERRELQQKERKRIKDRQREGINAAIKKGIKLGRKKIEIDSNFISIYKAWKEKKLSSKEAIIKSGMKSNTFYRRVKEYENTSSGDQ